MKILDLVTDEHLEFLDNLRESGVVNMFGAIPYIQNEFPDLSQKEATAILSYWMRTFSDRHQETKQ
jgi:uncharacterized protein YciI